MNQYETDKHVPDYGTVKRIAKVLNMPTSYFYCEDNDLAALIKNWQKLTRNKRKQLLKEFGVPEV